MCVSKQSTTSRKRSKHYREESDDSVNELNISMSPDYEGIKQPSSKRLYELILIISKRNKS